jgi:beta-galactosidase
VNGVRYLAPFFLFFLFFCGLVAGARTVQPFNSGWKFSFDQKSWSSVKLPHTWNAVDGLKPDYRRGDAWYKKQFRVKRSLGERVFIRFQAANQRAEVFLNGKWMGRHSGGFNAFAVELTSAVQWSESNQLLVRVNNAVDNDVAPISADFTSFGGIYRQVDLISVPATHISLDDYGSLGVLIHPLKVENSLAQIRVDTSLVSQENAKPIIQLQIKDASGRVRASQEGGASQTLQLKSPHLWNGVKDPYLYSLTASVMVNGKIVDSVSQNFGLRYFKVDPGQGVSLNGEPIRLKGVAMHQDWEGKGWALTEREFKRNVELLQEMGVNAVRLAHYPHAQETLDLLDRAGIVVWSEIPVVDHVGTSKGFAENAELQLKEMIRQNLHHPSILFWGLYNEVKDGPIQVLKSLNVLAHAEDPSRLTTAAFEGLPDAKFEPVTDIIGFNCYFGWYRGGPGDLGPYLDKLHKQYPKIPVGVSEYGAGASSTLKNDVLTRPETTSRVHPQSWQLQVHEKNWAEIEKRPFVWGSFVWNFFDFASAARHEGDLDGINDKGLISYDRKVKKKAFQFYKSKWNH